MEEEDAVDGRKWETIVDGGDGRVGKLDGVF